MSTALTVKIVGIVVACLVMLSVLFVAVFDIDWIRGWLAKQASEATGRDITVDHLAVDWSWTPKITVEGLEVANAAWGQKPHLAHVERLEVTIRLGELLRGRTVLPEVKVFEPDLFLEVNAEGRANWDLADDRLVKAAAKEAVVPDDRTELPTIEHLVIQDGAFAYLDAAREVDLEGTLATVVGDGGDGDKVEIEAQGKLSGAPFEIVLSGGR